jgi:hypothetical protein
MIELFREGVAKLEKAMNIVEDVPEVNNFYDPPIAEAYNALDDALVYWRDALNEMEEIEESQNQ